MSGALRTLSDRLSPSESQQSSVILLQINSKVRSGIFLIISIEIKIFQTYVMTKISLLILFLLSVQELSFGARTENGINSRINSINILLRMIFYRVY